MNFSDCIATYFSSDNIVKNLPELIAVVTGILSVWFAKKENILVYPVGIISVVLYVYICLHVGLYADAGINFYYFIVSIYGWYYWKHGGKFQHKEKTGNEIDSMLLEEEKFGKEKAEISSNSLVTNIFLLTATIATGIVLGFILQTYTDSNVPYWDGITTAIFFTAMWLMARKKIENWIFWVVGDAACIPLFLYKGLCLSSLQYLIFTVIAIAGYLSWFSKLQKNSPVSS